MMPVCSSSVFVLLLTASLGASLVLCLCGNAVFRLIRQMLRMRGSHILLIIVSLCYAGLSSYRKGNSVQDRISGLLSAPEAGAGPVASFYTPGSRSLTPGQRRAGLALLHLSTNRNASAVSEAYAVTGRDLEILNALGGAEETVYLPFPENFRFPFGTNEWEGAFMSASGTLSFNRAKGSSCANMLPDESGIDFMALLHGPYGLVAPYRNPGPPAVNVNPESAMRCFVTENDTPVFAWNNLFTDRSGPPVSFSVELLHNGGFIYRYTLTDENGCGASTACGAQANGGGETYAYCEPEKIVDGLTLYWRGFPPLPEGGSASDTDGDGITDDDEVFIHGTNPLLVDTDGDGLPDADEIREETDPLNPDTDGDGVPDGIPAAEWAAHSLFQYRVGKKPVTFIVTEPIPAYATAVLRVEDLRIPLDPAAGSSASNSHVKWWTLYLEEGEAYSAALHTTGGPSRPVRLLAEATDGFFAEDPSGIFSSVTVYPPAGRMQPAAFSGMAPASASSSGSGASSPGGGGSTPGSGGSAESRIGYLKAQILPLVAVWHDGQSYMDFTVSSVPVDIPGQGGINWSSAHGSMSPPSGSRASRLYWIPDPLYPVNTVTAEITGANVYGPATATRDIMICPGYQGLRWGAFTDNFSPHLGETAAIEVTAGCPHYNMDGYYFELELMRESTQEGDGWQHVAWLDADPRTTAKDRIYYTTNGWTGCVLEWDGIASEGAGMTESPDVFAGGTKPFNRIFPEVISGEPVPPPFYTVFARLKESPDPYKKPVYEIRRRIYVPQVVRIEMTDEAFEDFRKPILYPDTFYSHLKGRTDYFNCITSTVLYAGAPNISKNSVLASIAAKCNAFFPDSVNIVFTERANISGRYKELRISTETGHYKWSGPPLGRVLNEYCSWPNSDPYGKGDIYVNTIRRKSSYEKVMIENGFKLRGADEDYCLETMFPFTHNELAHAVASTSAHETGHMLGLVSHEFLGGTEHDWHNRNDEINGNIMNSGIFTPAVYHLGHILGKQRSWNQRNLNYYEFILPSTNGN